uniref:Taste receptor type 2 n=1 Tax=Scleropages formosus TaxID=113540 RepID=A0A8C9S2V3_SCLFO
MALSWSATLVYLCKHMKRMQTNSVSFSSAGLRRQLRVIIMGIIQTALSLFFFCFSVLYWYYLLQYDQNYYLCETVYLFLSFGTTVNLGLGQSLFRKKTAKFLTCSVWLSVFYYSRIVPAQQAFFIWIKKNIKTIIYCGLTLEHFLNLTQFFLGTPWMSNQRNDIFTENQNVTSQVDTKSIIYIFLQVLNFSNIFFFIVVMALSWGSTLVYLCRHMKRMEMISSRFSSSRLRSQFRVTIMSVVQTGLSLSFVFFIYLYWYYLKLYDQNFYAIETTYSLFSFGTTLNIGLGQSLIRKKIANCFKKFPLLFLSR